MGAEREAEEKARREGLVDVEDQGDALSAQNSQRFSIAVSVQPGAEITEVLEAVEKHGEGEGQQEVA